MDYLIQTLFISLQYAFSCVSWIFMPIFCIKGICIYLIKSHLLIMNFMLSIVMLCLSIWGNLILRKNFHSLICKLS